MNGISESTLIRLLKEDGVKIPDNTHTEKMIFCFSQYHDNTRTPSMSINTLEGVYYCHSCGIRGNAYIYLTAIRGYSKEKAIDTLKKHGWGEAGIKEMMNKLKEREHKKHGLPLYVEKPYDILTKDGKPIARQEAVHDYKTADGKLVCRAIRYEQVGTEKASKVSPFLNVSFMMVLHFNRRPDEEGIKTESSGTPRKNGPFEQQRILKVKEPIERSDTFDQGI